MPAPRNPLKQALAAGTCMEGLWLNLGSALGAEIAGHAGCDWCLIDAEHGPYDLAALQAQLIALAGTGAAPVVRVPVGAAWILKQVLDLGVQTIMVPMIESAAQAEEMVQAVRYPPHGVRGVGAGVARASGFGRIADYVATADAEICLILQVESRAALAALPEICAVDGVDVVFIGPADLGADMGYLHDLDHAEVQQAINGAIETINAAGKASGIIAFSAERIAEYRARGIGFLGIGSDGVLLAEAIRAALGSRGAQ